MTSTAGNENVTPDPSIHDVPSVDDNTLTLPSAQQFEAWGEQLLTGVANSIVEALLNVNILGVDPFTALQEFGEDPASIISTITTALGGIGSGIAGLESALENIPLIGPLIEQLGGDGSGLTGLVSAIEALPQDLIKTLTSFLSGGVTVSVDLSDLASLLDNIPLIGPLIEELTGAGGDSDGGGGVSAIVSAITSLPVDAENLYNQISSGLLGLLPSSQVGNTSPNLLTNPGFDSAASLATNPDFTWDGTVGHTTVGSAKATADGTTKTVVSNTVAVSQNQVLQVSAWTRFSGVTSSANPISLAINGYDADNNFVATTVLQSIAASGDSSGWTQLSGSYTVPATVTSVVVQLQVSSSATVGTVWFDDASLTKTGLMSGSWMSGISGTVESDLQSIVTNIVSTLTGSVSAGIDDLVTALQNIPSELVTGLLGPSNIGASLQATVDNLWQAFTGDVEGVGNSLQNLVSAASNMVGSVASSVDISQQNSYTLTNRAVTKPGYHAIDPTVDAVFDITTIGSASAGVPTTVSVTSAASVMGALSTPDGGVKESITWWGGALTNITGIYLTIYAVDASTGAFDEVYQTGNIISGVTASAQNYYDLPSANYLSTAQGDWYVIELAITGTGTYAVAGLPNHWLGANTNVHPSQLGWTRNTSSGVTAPATITNPSPSQNIPWFGLGGSASASSMAPVTQEFLSSDTYTVPTWLQSGDRFDIIALGGGGGASGGASGFGIYFAGNGGYAGSWEAITLTYGIDIPLTTTSFTVTVGGGGSGGASAEADGAAGGNSTVAITGYGTITADGGSYTSKTASTSNGWANTTDGESPGYETFNGQNYPGGAEQTATGATGNSPGGGGSGEFDEPGGAGAGCAVWIRAYQV